MRNLIIIILLFCFAQAVYVTSYAQGVDLTLTAQNSSTPRLQRGKRAESLISHEKFTLETVGNNLGAISAIVYDGDTHYFTADKKSGRIWRLMDRNKDGRIDTKRALAHRFDEPTGLAIKGDSLYIADNNAVWVVDNLQPPQKLAGLRNANSEGERHVLTLSQDKNSLILGLTTAAQKVKILSININSGQAELVNELSTTQKLIDFGLPNQASPWVVLSHSFGSNLSNLYQVDPSHKLHGMAIPSFETENQALFKNHIYLSRQSSNGFDVLKTPMNLGQVSGQSEIILSGFLSATKRSAWGAPGTLLFDRHGLIIADGFNGDIYRLRPKTVLNKQIDLPKDIEKAVIEVPNDEAVKALEETTPRMRISTMEGSQIGKASTIERGSTLNQKDKPSSMKDNENKKPKNDKPN